VRRGALLLASAAALAAAGCGDDEQEKAGTKPSGRDGLEAVVRQCRLSGARSAAPDLVPVELRPAHTRVVSAERTADGYRASLLFDRPFAEVYGVLRRQAAAAGHQVLKGEREAAEAELFLERDGQRTEMRLSPLRYCPQYSQASVEGREGV
jgi:hypothetical protein